jgi:hypothetical protein
MNGTAILETPPVGEQLVTVCCHCRRVRFPGGQWETRFLPDQELVSHGICASCFREFYPTIRMPDERR